MNIGDVIRRHRKRLKLSREALASKAGISERSIYGYESNKQSPTLTQLQAIAKSLKLTVPELLDETFKLERKMSEEEIVDQILSLRYRSDIRSAGVVKILAKVLQRLPLDLK